MGGMAPSVDDLTVEYELSGRSRWHRMRSSPQFFQAGNVVIGHIFLQIVQYSPWSTETDQIRAAYLYGCGACQDVFDRVLDLKNAADAYYGHVYPRFPQGLGSLEDQRQ
jgi:hypothetical protein